MKAGACPSCGSGNTRDLGPIPSSETFAGQVVPPMPARLAICRECQLGFKSPQPSRERLAELYAAGSESAWVIEDQARPDWTEAARLLREIGAATVLDVGCFDGAFFDLVDDSVGKFGIEINPEAAARARARGVEVLAADLHDLATLANEFDCAVAFDVIEHLHDPAEFLAVLQRIVKPGGHVIFATGNFSAPTQRFMGSRYLYSWYQEHIAFVSPRWALTHAPRLGFDVVRITRFSHHAEGTPAFLLGLAKNTAYRVAPRLFARVRRRLRDVPIASQDGPVLPPPAWLSARDHFLVLLRKSGASR